MGGIFTEQDKKLTEKQVMRTQEPAYERSFDKNAPVNMNSSKKVNEARLSDQAHIEKAIRTKKNEEFVKKLKKSDKLDKGDWKKYKLPAAGMKKTVPAAKNDGYYLAFEDMSKKKGWNKNDPDRKEDGDEQDQKQEEKDRKKKKTVDTRPVGFKTRSDARVEGGIKKRSCAREYTLFERAAGSITTGYFEKTNMILLKKKLDGVKSLLAEPVGAQRTRDFYTLKTELLAGLYELRDACRFYMRKTEADNAQNGNARYEQISVIFRKSLELMNYYESLSEERFENAAEDAVTLGGIMKQDKTKNNESPTEAKQTKALVRRLQHNIIDDLRQSLFKTTDAGRATGIYREGENLKKLLKGPVSAKSEDFAIQRKKVIEAYTIVINLCEFYSTKKSSDPPHFQTGRNRLDAVRRLLGIYRREAEYIASITREDLLMAGRVGGSWDEVLRQGPRLVSGVKEDKKKQKYPDETEDVGYESGLLSNILGMQGMYSIAGRAILKGENGSIRKCYEKRNTASLQDTGLEKPQVMKKIIDYAVKQEEDIAYSDNALKQLSAIRIMDYLTGRKGRTEDDLRFKAREKNVEGVLMVSIESVISMNDHASFSADAPDDPVEARLVDGKGRFLFAYDTAFADHIMDMDLNALMQELVDQGARLDEKTQSAFVQRFRRMQELLINDLDKGWRAEITEQHEEKEGGNDATDMDIRREYSENSDEMLPGYIRPELLRNHREKPPMADISKPLNAEENPWTDVNGNLLKEVEFKEIEQDPALLEKFQNEVKEKQAKNPGLSEEVIRRVFNQKRKIEFIQQYKNSNSRSGYLMKKAKADLAADVAKDLQATDENSSAEYKKALELLASYAGMMSTAQYEHIDRELRMKEERKGESEAETIARIYDPERTRAERNTLREARALIEKRLKELEKKDKPDASEIEEKTKLKAYSDKLSGLCDGKLKIDREKDKVLIKPDNTLKAYDLKKEDTGFEIVSRNESGEFKFRDAELREEPVLSEVKMRDARNMPLFTHEPCIEDVVQGKMGDCYAMAVIAALAEHDPDAIKNMMKDNGNGFVTVRLFSRKGREVYIDVEKTVPYDPRVDKEDIDFYARDCLWVQMIEKAYTASGLAREWNDWGPKKYDYDMKDQEWVYKKLDKKGFRTYESIRGGSASEFVQVLTGVSSGSIQKEKTGDAKEINRLVRNMKDPNGDEEDKAEFRVALDSVVNDIRDAEKDKKLILAGSRNDLKAVDGVGLSGGERIMRGISGKHSYTVLGIRKIGDEEFIAIRNPWGRTTVNREVNELTGGISIRNNRGEASSFLLTPTEFLLFFDAYRIVDMPEKANEV